MKKFSKESMQQFLLMHAEKLILAACLVATGAFVWMSMGDEKKSAQHPSDLLKTADAADTYINSDDAWTRENGLQQIRKGKVEAKERIASTEPVDGNKFRLNFGGSPAEALAPRKDPLIVAPERLIARRFTTAVMLNLAYASPLSKFSDAPGSGNRDSGSGNRDSGSDSRDSGSDSRGSGSDSRDSGSDSRDSGSGSRPGELHEDFVPLNRSGVFNKVNELTSTGIRPKGLEVPEKAITSVLDVVCVTAVVDFKKQVAAFESAFAESIAYNAKRDSPVYQFLQVQRREVAKDGGESEWRDISEDVTYKFASSNPLPRMPFQVFGSAPEVSSPDHFDPIITHAIPAFVQLDYQELASHPDLKTRREFPAWKAPEQLDEIPRGDDDIFNSANQNLGNDGLAGGGGAGGDDDINSLRSGTNTQPYREAIEERKPGGQYRLVRFFDLRAPKNKSFEYRVRVWVGDPNQLDPLDGFAKNRGQQLKPFEGGEKRNDKGPRVQFAGAGDGMKGMSEMGDKGQRGDGDDKPEVVLPVKPTMLIPSARSRIAGGADFEIMLDQLEEVARRLASGNNGGDKFQPFHVAEYSSDGNLEQIELPPSPSGYAYMQYLRYARPSAWSESVQVKKERPTADVLAGTTVRSRSVELQGNEFEQVESAIKVLVSYWARTLGAKLSVEKKAYIGETMNFRSKAYVTDPITWKIKVPEVPKVEGIKKYDVPFPTNVTIVDAFFGSKQELPIVKGLSMELPTEILVMDANGNFKISNQFAAATEYRNELAMPDDTRFYGRPPKRRKTKEDEPDDDFGDGF